MNTKKQFITTLALSFWIGLLLAMPPYYDRKPTPDITNRAACAKPTQQRNLDINNVRAKLWNGGDMWWEHGGGPAAYVIPKAGINGRFVSSLFAGGIWVGGYDDNNNPFIAATTYGNGNATGGDWYPGPLNPATRNTLASVCSDWNKMFDVKGADIELLKKEYYELGNTDLCASANPAIVAALEGLKRWPGRGNSEFSNYYGFGVPAQEMAPFFDRAGDDVYDPCDGDFPKINIRGCEDNGNFRKAQYGDQMLWWVYNDLGAGAPHNETKAAGMGMEVQVQAFSYTSDDALNDMTFYRYKLLNRAAFNMKETYMSLWSDPDLGCSVDDYVGCINDITRIKARTVGGKTIIDTTTRSMGFVYNADGDDNVTCPGNGGQGYGLQIPILGVDYFRGPNEKAYITDSATNQTFPYLKELGMTSFSYYRIGGDGQKGDPNSAPQYFNYMRGLWRDGTPYYPCGDASVPCATPGTTKFVFPGHPDKPNEWSMAKEGFAANDFRFLHTTGPFKMESGATNEIISGVPWVPNQVYPKPNLSQIIAADDLAQGIFDNCFDILDGPDAPELTIIEGDKSLVVTLKPVGNNVATVPVKDGAETVLRRTGEAYEEISPAIPSNYPDSLRTYKFEGYRIYQLASSEVNFNEAKGDPKQVREIFSVDLKNGVKKLINWELDAEVPGLFVRKTQIVANDGGIKHSFEVTRDQFGSGTNAKLINHKKYYFKAVSYAYNNYKEFLPFEPNNADRGQKSMYIAGRRGVDATYIGVPRRTIAESLGKTTTANYGDIPAIIRADGKGNDGLFLDLDKYTLSDTAVVQEGYTAGELAYKRGFGPVEVKVVDPLAVSGGNYVLTLSRDSTGRSTIANPSNISKTYWELKQTVGSTTRRWVSERDLVFNTDQYIPDLGISIRVAQPLLAAQDRRGANGFIGATIDYADTTKAWFAGVKDEEQRYGGSRILEILSTGPAQADQAIDSNKVYNGVLNGWIMPYPLCDCQSPVPQLATPAWQAPFPFCQNSLSAVRSNTPATMLDNLNNVDIVFTADKSKWSRCIVVETTPTSYQTDPNNPFKTVATPTAPATLGTKGGVPMFGLRSDSSVNKSGTVDGTGTGMGWFPGYAVDVETGKRLNIFFGEATHYRGIKDINGDFIVPGGTGGNVITGGDMIFNPSTAWIHGDQGPQQQPISALFQAAFGGFHNIYVTREAYDSCKALGSSATGLRGNPANAKKGKALSKITWTAIVLPTIDMLPIEKGLIPTETTIKLRVNSQYAKALGTNSNQAQPQYRFNLDKFVPLAADDNQSNTVLDEIKVVPNPYYSYSDYELNENDSRIKIANLPPECTVTIYSLDGRFIRQFKRNEDKVQPNTRSIIPSLEWDLKNGKGIPIASGVYLIHISAPGIGDRVIKWFGVNRALDASRL